MSQIQALIEKARRYLRSAELLIQDGDYDSAVSRSYYAMFYSVLALLNLVGQGTSKHSGAIALFNREFVKSGLFDKQFSKWLQEAFRRRQKSDYDEMVQLTIDEASQAAKEARQFVEEVKRYLAENLK